MSAMRIQPQGSNSTTCTEWHDSRFLSNGDCVELCPAGHYVAGAGTTGFTCQACESNCRTCSNSTLCTDWQDSKYLSNDECVDFCPAEYYEVGNGTTGLTCQACELNCETCSNSTVCTQCVDSKYLSGTDCVDVCPAGYYESVLEQRDSHANRANQTAQLAVDRLHAQSARVRSI